MLIQEIGAETPDDHSLTSELVGQTWPIFEQGKLLIHYSLNRRRDEIRTDHNNKKSGEGIPIVLEEWLRSMKLDYHFVVSWHFRVKFAVLEKEFFESGARFNLPVPEFEIFPDGR